MRLYLGTAKTTICTSIANYLGWNFLTIDTACFLANGLENIASRMTYIFNRLNSLERTIILFDEIEEFCLDRENPSLGMESRLLTTAMLTQVKFHYHLIRCYKSLTSSLFCS